jgi:hypothetical protein
MQRTSRDCIMPTGEGLGRELSERMGHGLRSRRLEPRRLQLGNFAPLRMKNRV